MALNSGALHSAVTNFLSATKTSTAQAAAAFAQLYDDYASQGKFGSNTLVVTGAKSRFEGALAAGLSSGVFPTVCTAFATAVTAYWTGATVTGAQSGPVTPPPGAAAIPAALAALAPKASRAVAASTLANALHSATITTTATVAPPPGTVLPIA